MTCVFERLPNVVIGAGGKISLVYLTRRRDQNSWQLRSAKLEIDPKTALPRMQRRSAARRCWPRTLRRSPLVVSANGEYVYAIDGAGQIVEAFDPQVIAVVPGGCGRTPVRQRRFRSPHLVDRRLGVSCLSGSNAGPDPLRPSDSIAGG